MGPYLEDGGLSWTEHRSHAVNLSDLPFPSPRAAQGRGAQEAQPPGLGCRSEDLDLVAQELQEVMGVGGAPLTGRGGTSRMRKCRAMDMITAASSQGFSQGGIRSSDWFSETLPRAQGAHLGPGCRQPCHGPTHPVWR